MADKKRAQTHTPRTRGPDWRGSGGARTQTHTTQHPSQEWRDAAKTRTEAHTSARHTPARNGGIQAESGHKQTHPNSRARNGGVKPNLKSAQHTPATIGWTQRKIVQEYVHHKPQPGMGKYGLSKRTNTDTPSPLPGLSGCRHTPRPNTHTTDPSQDRRCKAKTGTQTHTPYTPAWIGGVTTKPGPNHKRHTTVGNPVFKARALKQPDPCR